MTPEVVVMNRAGVALAADSAVTLDMGNSSKVRDSALKMFRLSKYHPVGVMIYNNAQILGVPLETTVKMFRRGLGRRSFDALHEYGDELIDFLDNNTTLFPENSQITYFLKGLQIEFQRIYEQVQTEIDYGEDPTSTGRRVIAERLEFWERQKDAEYLSVSAREFVGIISDKVSPIVNQVAASVGVGSRAAVKDLYEIARHLVGKDYFPSDVMSGLVIAGFGEAEHFPTVMDIQVGGIYGNRLKARSPSLVPITDERPSEVKAFAYTDMVEAFLHGISPTVLPHLVNAEAFIREMPAPALGAVSDLSRAERAMAADTIREVSRRKSVEFAENVLQGLNDRYNKLDFVHLCGIA